MPLETVDASSLEDWVQTWEFGFDTNQITGKLAHQIAADAAELAITEIASEMERAPLTGVDAESGMIRFVYPLDGQVSLVGSFSLDDLLHHARGYSAADEMEKIADCLERYAAKFRAAKIAG